MAETLSALDASFLLLERAWAPMHFGGLSLLEPGPEGPLSIDELREVVGRRFRALPRLGCRPVFAWHGLRHPAWERTGVDLDAHVRHHVLGGEGEPDQLLDLAGLLHARPLDHGRPLWELHLVDGLRDGRQALLMKVHHSLADGIGGLDVADALFDPRPVPPAHEARREHPVRTAPWLPPLQLVEGAGRFLAGGLQPPASLFTQPVGPRRQFAVAAVDRADLWTAKRRLGGTVDDVLLEIVAAGLTRHLAKLDGAAPASLRVMVPISTRGLAGGGSGNHVTAMFVDLPLATEAGLFVERVGAAKHLLRQFHEGPALATLVEVSGTLPAPLQRAVARLATAVPTFNLVVSDIPGPSVPYRLLGREVQAMYPLMPLAPSAGLSIAALSVGRVVGIGVTADPAQVTDARGLAAEIGAAARDLGRVAFRPAPARLRGAGRRGTRSARRCAPAPPAAAASRSASARRSPR